MKVLIVYYSLSSNNELLAFELRRRLDCDVIKINEHRKRTKFTILFDRVFNRVPKITYPSVAIESYGHIILVSPVWTSAIASPLKAFLLLEKERINHYSFISVCGGGQTDQHDKLSKELAMLVHQEPDQVSELPISELIPPDKRDDPTFIINFKFTEKELAYFEPQIENFLHAIEAVTL